MVRAGNLVRAVLENATLLLLNYIPKDSRNCINCNDFIMEWEKVNLLLAMIYE